MGPVAPKRGEGTLDLRQAKPKAPAPVARPAAPAEDVQEEQLFDYPEVQEEAPQPAVKPKKQKRFWRSFWRFVLILLVLGLLISAGIYVYLNYFHQS
jgi:hypothetical protein